MLKIIPFFVALIALPFAAQAEKISNSQDVESCKSYKLCIHVSKGKQRMVVWLNVPGVGPTAIGSGQSFNEGGLDGARGAKISTARGGKSTPTGTFKIEEVAWAGRRSNRYDRAALFYAMQLDGHIFIHATSPGNYGALGFRASAGCVRTTLVNAELINTLMLEIGADVDQDSILSAEEFARSGKNLGRGGVLNSTGRANIRVVITST